MTRNWKLTLAAASPTKYNLWTLISADPSFTDPTFTKAPYVPSSVCELVITPDSAAMSIMEDGNQQVPLAIAVGVPFVKRTSVNAISLKSYSLTTATAGGTVDVSITAL